MSGGGEVAIAQATASAFAQHELLAVFGKVGREFAFDGVNSCTITHVFLA